MYVPTLSRFTARDPIGENGVDLLFGPELQWLQQETDWHEHEDLREQQYVYVKNSPIDKTDPSGLSAFCTVAIVYHNKLVIERYLDALDSLPYVLPRRKNHPHQHCVWSCRMTRAEGVEFAWEYGHRKELIDETMANLRDFLQTFGCWCLYPKFLRDFVDEHADSAFQVADAGDNAVGIACGLILCGDPDPSDDTDCEDCCTCLGIHKDTEEGPGTPRPYGPRSHPKRYECPGDFLL